MGRLVRILANFGPDLAKLDQSWPGIDKDLTICFPILTKFVPNSSELVQHQPVLHQTYADSDQILPDIGSVSVNKLSTGEAEGTLFWSVER